MDFKIWGVVTYIIQKANSESSFTYLNTPKEIIGL